MNTHDIELPPNPITPMLAALIDKASCAGTSEAIWQLMQEFANQAIEADRQRRGDHPVLRYMPEILAALKYPNVNVSLVEDIEAALDAPQPAEPVREQSMRELIADDAYAATFQSVGQYRRALLARYGKGTP